ncbi:hypothetical protein V1227_16380 [Lentzea sp. DG1S-22]|uniref:hypothetical protein n=1 Tax=Lentzea sp. DG1S-22 TaxID=3108822 RepID=UPI002E7675C8|nr:hypothetical protein [Lentzea sp. DG1S-22]WVH84257.1 hypothetical protein V1227_16380 [Lentzea sp. DG1S-22]
MIEQARPRKASWISSLGGDVMVVQASAVPMERLKQPKSQKSSSPSFVTTKKVLGTCKGKDFMQLREKAVIRLCYNTAASLSEVGTLSLEASVRTSTGKGDKDCRVRYGPKTTRAISR